MLRSILALIALASTVSAQGGCTSFSTLVHGTTGAPQGLGIPDCSYIQANAAAICNSLGAWDIVNGNACQMRGPGYGCQFSNTVFTTQETFYCQLGPAAAVATSTATSSPSASGSVTAVASASPVVTPSASASVSASPVATPSASASVSASPVATPSASASASASPVATPSGSASVSTSPLATSSSTSTHTINPVYVYINTTTLVPVTVVDTSIGKGQAAAIGLAAIFGTFTIGCLCFVILQRRRPAEKEQLPVSSRRPSMVVRDPPSRRPSAVVVLKSEV